MQGTKSRGNVMIPRYNGDDSIVALVLKLIIRAVECFSV